MSTGTRVPDGGSSPSPDPAIATWSSPQPHLASAAARLTLVNAFVMALGIVTGPLLARALGPAGRGTLAAIFVPLAIAPAIADLGLSAYASRRAARGAPLGALLTSVGGPLLAVGAVGMLLAVPLAAALSQGHHVVFVFVAAGLLLLPLALANNFLLAMATALERWRIVIVVRLIPFSLAAAAMVVLFLVGELTVSTAAVALLVSGALAFIPLAPLLRTTGLRGFDRNVTREAFAFGVKAWLGSLSPLILSRLDQLLMIWLVAREDLGLYVVAATYAGLTGFFTEPLRWVLVARVARGHSDVAARAVRLAVVGLGGANLLLALLAPAILPLVFGSAFADSVQIAWLLLAAAVPGQAAVVLTAALTASGRPGRSATAQLVALFLSVPGLLLMLPLLGAIGAALVSLIVQTVNLAFLLAFARGHFDLPMRAFLLVNATDLELLRRLAKQRLRKVVSVRGKRPGL